jgi:hypothetical protein
MSTPSPLPAQIVLSPEQESLVASSSGRIPVYRADGRFFGFIRPVETPTEPLFTPEEIASAERELDANVSCISTAELLAKLRREYGE